MRYPELDLLVLKAIITNKQCALDFASGCSSNIFDTSLWHAANLIITHIKTYKDIPTLNILIEKIPKTTPALTETVTNIWQQIENTTYNDKEYKHNLEKLQYRFSVEQILNLKSKLETLQQENVNPKKIVKDLQQTVQNITSITKTKTYDRKTLKDSLIPFREEVNAKLNNPNFDRGIPTNYSFIDNATDGLRPGELLIIGGESNSGKSMLLMNLAVQMWMQKNTIDMTSNFTLGHNILYFSLEMPFKPCRNRIYSRLSGVPSRFIKRPITDDGRSRLNEQDRHKLKTALQFIDKYPYQFEIVDIPRGATPEQLEILFEESKTRYNPEIIVIDYLGLMEAESSNEDDWLKLGLITGQVHEMCRAQNIIGLTAVQLNRTKSTSKDTEEKIGMHRIGRSSLIMTHADVGIQIETRPNEKNYPDMITHLIKVRDGELGRGKLLKNLACGTLLDNDETDGAPTFINADDITEEIEFFDI